MAKDNKTNMKNDLKETSLRLIKIVIVIILILTLVYLLTSFLSKNGNFSKDYIPLSTSEAVMTYEEATVGTVFNRVDKEYYVIFEDFGNTNKTYIETLLDKYLSKEKHKAVYKVDMSLDINSKYKSNVSNKNASSSNELKIKTPTLIYIKDGLIKKYIEGNDKIKSELK